MTGAARGQGTISLPACSRHSLDPQGDSRAGVGEELSSQTQSSPCPCPDPPVSFILLTGTEMPRMGRAPVLSHSHTRPRLASAAICSQQLGRLGVGCRGYCSLRQMGPFPFGAISQNKTLRAAAPDGVHIHCSHFPDPFAYQEAQSHKVPPHPAKEAGYIRDPASGGGRG